MSTTDEELLIGEILKMKEQGFEASKAEVLPGIFKRIYSTLYNTGCSACIEDAYNGLIKWAAKKQSTKLNFYMAYKLKQEYKNKSFPVLHKGQRVVITADNLTDERAKILLSIPKYAHVLEPNGKSVPVTSAEKTKSVKVKQEPDQVIEPKLEEANEEVLITPEMEVVPNDSEATTSTSSAAPAAKKSPRQRRGK